MPRQTYVWDREQGRLVEAAFFYANRPRTKRSDLPTPQIAGDYEAYECPITGKPVEGRAAHRENLKRHGCRVLEPGEKADAKKRRQAEADAALDKILK